MKIGEYEANQIYYTEDSLIFMKSIPDKSIDWIITDPPYGIEIEKMGFTTTTNGGIAKRNDYSNTGKWDSKRLDKVYFDEIFRVSKNQIIFGGNYYTDYLPPTKSWLIWDKKTEDKYSNSFADCEMAWCSKDVARIIRFMWSGMLQENMKEKEKRYHPTQKPVALFEKIILTYTNNGELIYDPFLGSGTTCLACQNTNRLFLGTENKKEYYEIALKRINENSKYVKLDLFNESQEEQQTNIFDYGIK